MIFGYVLFWCGRDSLCLLKQVCSSGTGIDIVELEVPEDHNYRAVRSIAKQSSSLVMQVIKNITAREFFRSYPKVKIKYFWVRELLI
jgi:REP element-mobilizing transposase RayT